MYRSIQYNVLKCIKIWNAGLLSARETKYKLHRKQAKCEWGWDETKTKVMVYRHHSSEAEHRSNASVEWPRSSSLFFCSCELSSLSLSNVLTTQAVCVWNVVAAADGASGLVSLELIRDDFVAHRPGARHDVLPNDLIRRHVDADHHNCGQQTRDRSIQCMYEYEYSRE